MKPSVALLDITLCLSCALAFNNIAEEIATAAKKISHGQQIVTSYTSLNVTSLLIAEPYQISQIVLDPPSRKSIKRTSYIGGLDYHIKHNLVYWSEISTGRINARRLIGPHSFKDELIVELSPKEWRPRSIAVDYVTDNMYVLDTRGKKVHVFNLEKKSRTVIFEGELKAPTDIVVDPKEAVMFVADETRILRFNMDGSGLTPVISHPRYRIKAVTLDSTNKRLFWSDVTFHRIKSATYDGKDVKILVKNIIGENYHVLGPAQLSYYDGWLYFYDDIYRTISVLEVNNNGAKKNDELTVLYDRIDVRVIKVMNSGKQTWMGKNPCYDTDCQQLCLIAKKIEGTIESKCACDFDMKLDDDAKRCL